MDGPGDAGRDQYAELTTPRPAERTQRSEVEVVVMAKHRIGVVMATREGSFGDKPRRADL